MHVMGKKMNILFGLNIKIDVNKKSYRLSMEVDL